MCVTLSFRSRFKSYQEARKVSYRAPTTHSVDQSRNMKWHVVFPGFWLRWLATSWMAEQADLQGSGLSCRTRNIRAYKATYTACSSHATHPRIVILLSRAATSLEKPFLSFEPISVIQCFSSRDEAHYFLYMRTIYDGKCHRGSSLPGRPPNSCIKADQ